MIFREEEKIISREKKLFSEGKKIDLLRKKRFPEKKGYSKKKK